MQWRTCPENDGFLLQLALWCNMTIGTKYGTRFKTNPRSNVCTCPSHMGAHWRAVIGYKHIAHFVIIIVRHTLSSLWSNGKTRGTKRWHRVQIITNGKFGVNALPFNHRISRKNKYLGFGQQCWFAYRSISLIWHDPAPKDVMCVTLFDTYVPGTG